MSEKSLTPESGVQISLSEVHNRLESQRLRDLARAPWASIKDYQDLQGGVPKVIESGKITIIIHNYIPNGPIVRSHKSIEDYGTTKRYVKSSDSGISSVRSFATALLWSEHGGPCESASKHIGGEGYPRIKNIK